MKSSFTPDGGKRRLNELIGGGNTHDKASLRSSIRRKVDHSGASSSVHDGRSLTVATTRNNNQEGTRLQQHLQQRRRVSSSAEEDSRYTNTSTTAAQELIQMGRAVFDSSVASRNNVNNSKSSPEKSKPTTKKLSAFRPVDHTKNKGSRSTLMARDAADDDEHQGTADNGNEYEPSNTPVYRQRQLRNVTAAAPVVHGRQAHQERLTPVASLRETSQFDHRDLHRLIGVHQQQQLAGRLPPRHHAGDQSGSVSLSSEQQPPAAAVAAAAGVDLGLAALLQDRAAYASLLGGTRATASGAIPRGLHLGAAASLVNQDAILRAAALESRLGLGGASALGGLPLTSATDPVLLQLIQRERLLALAGLSGGGLPLVTSDPVSELLTLRRLQADQVALARAATAGLQGGAIAATTPVDGAWGAAVPSSVASGGLTGDHHQLSSATSAPTNPVEVAALIQSRHGQSLLPRSAAARPGGALGSSVAANSGPATSMTPGVNRPRPLVPPCDEGTIRHHLDRLVMPLATDEDENWLSEFSYFVRADLVEVFRASQDDVASRINSKKVVYGQVGIRCRHCAHLSHNQRASRSACFPSSLSRIYQSLTMMIRDHFVRCTGMPDPVKQKFLTLKQQATQGATDSKRYWVDSAKKIGIIDTEQGMMIREDLLERAANGDNIAPPIVQARALRAPTAAAVSQSMSNRQVAPDKYPDEGAPLVYPEDQRLVSKYHYTLMTQVEKVYMTESERVGNRKSMVAGLPGFCCKHCRPTNRKGLCRFFPARRRTLPAKMKDLHDHLRRCTLCPAAVKEELALLEEQGSMIIVSGGTVTGPPCIDTSLSAQIGTENRKAFFDRIWNRLHVDHARASNDMDNARD